MASDLTTVSFDYVTEEMSAVRHIVERYHVSTRTARNAVGRAVNRDTYVGRGYVVRAWDGTGPDGRITHTIAVSRH